MSRNIVTGIDIGTATTKVVVTELTDKGELQILGVGTSPTNGLRNGYIVELEAAVKSVGNALNAAVKSARLRPSHAYLSIGGISLAGTVQRGTAYVRHSDGTISEQDFEKAMGDATTNAESALINKKTIHDIPIASTIDDEPALGNPIGMQGSKLENTVMLVHALESHIDDFISAIEDAGVEVVDVTAGPLAASFASLSAPQKMQGCVLLDIGAESTDVIVFENNTPIALRVLSSGSNDITNALAIDLKVSPADAEQIKKGSLIGTKYTQVSIDKIIAKNMNKLFANVKDILKSLDEGTMLPSGVLITGGGARLHNIEELARTALKLPTKVVYATEKQVAGNPELTVAYGLCLWGASSAEETSNFPTLKKTMKKVGVWFRHLLP